MPDKFLGGLLKPASGQTNVNGMVAPSVPATGPGDVPGVAPGFYRIEVTRAGENIPAEYNSQTILGREIAAVSRLAPATTAADNPIFDLKY